ncbi:MAG: DUF6236 family protein [Candidatus Omnitrophica bacterium]|nr:DUF6236 family protein [Candidatus Omnitrophota bacterium]
MRAVKKCNGIEDTLYYPYIHFQNNAWLKAMALFYNRIYRIVPPTISPTDSDDIKALIETDEVGCAIDPVPYASEASNTFREKIGYNWNAASLSFNKTEKDNFDRLHITKTDEAVRRLFEKMGFKEDDGWIGLPKEMASNYMLYLSTIISEKNGLSLVTDGFPSWTATNYFNSDGLFPDYISFKDIYGDKDSFSLYSLILQQLCPINIEEIPSGRIVLFRKERRDEIANLRKNVNSLYDTLSNIEDFTIFKDKIRNELQNIKQAIEDYKKSADLLNVKDWIGINLFALTSTNELLSFFKIESLARAMLLGTGVAVGFIYALTANKKNIRILRKKHPYSCLALMSEDFKDFTGQRGGGDVNFHAYNCLEEYIND